MGYDLKLHVPPCASHPENGLPRSAGGGSGRRSYSARLGRWTRRDQIGEVGGINTYGYVGNSAPLGHDYLGLLSETYRERSLVCTHELDERHVHGSTERQPALFGFIHPIRELRPAPLVMNFDRGKFTKIARMRIKGNSHGCHLQCSVDASLSPTGSYRLKPSAGSGRRLIVKGCCPSRKLIVTFTKKVVASFSVAPSGTDYLSAQAADIRGVTRDSTITVSSLTYGGPYPGGDEQTEGPISEEIGFGGHQEFEVDTRLGGMWGSGAASGWSEVLLSVACAP